MMKKVRFRVIDARGDSVRFADGSALPVNVVIWATGYRADYSWITIPGVGHAVSPASPCAQAVIVSFLADPASPGTSCVGALKPPSFTSVGSP